MPPARLCNWLIEDDNPDNAPHYCGRRVVAVYLDMVSSRRYYRCSRHDTDMAQATIKNDPNLERYEIDA